MTDFGCFLFYGTLVFLLFRAVVGGVDVVVVVVVIVQQVTLFLGA